MTTAATLIGHRLVLENAAWDGDVLSVPVRDDDKRARIARVLAGKVHDILIPLGTCQLRRLWTAWAVTQPQGGGRSLSEQQLTEPQQMASVGHLRIPFVSYGETT